MRGYWNRPDDSAGVLRDGWLHTGDLATVAPDGSVAIVGRTKELIKCKGSSVAPAELEAVLLEHPGVADCAVVGRPDHEAGEVPVAFVVARRESPVEPAELVSFAAARLAGYKRIRAVELVEALPRSPAGKGLRHALLPSAGGGNGATAA